MAIEFPPYEPDRSILDPSNTNVVNNVLPAPTGWAPMKGHSALSSALEADVKGAISVIRSDGTAYIFAGTTDKLWLYNSGTQSFDDVSTAATTYAVPTDEIWSFHQFGDILLATNQTDGLYYYELTGGSAFVNAANAPLAKYVSNIGEYVVLANLDSFANRIQWSEIGSVTEWTIGDNGAGRQDLPDGGEIRGITFGEDSIHILQQRGIRVAQYIGGDFTFQFEKVNTARGCASPYSLVSAANSFFYFDEDGFYQGSEGIPIGGEKVDRYVLANMDLDFIAKVQGAADPTNKVVWWRFPKEDGTNDMVGYDWQLQRWTFSNTDMNYLFPAVSASVSLEGLDSISASIDALQYSLDSRVWLGGRPTFAGFNSSNEFGFFSGDNLAATVETADVKLQPENSRSMVTGYRIVTDADTHTGQVSKKIKSSSATNWDNATSPVSDSGLITSRANGRYHRFRCNIPVGEVWTYVHAVFPYIRPGGRR